MTTFARIRTRFPFVHHWPHAEGRFDILKHPHRHEFHVVLDIEQFHNDRDVEYLEAKRVLDNFLAGAIKVWPMSMSCENMCEEIVTWASAQYADIRRFRVEVSEDGENGSYLEA